jgi:hypothetical protein
VERLGAEQTGIGNAPLNAQSRKERKSFAEKQYFLEKGQSLEQLKP